MSNQNAFDPVNFLLVDDRQENLVALEALLRREGLVLLMATSGTEALELLLRFDVALAFIDIQMPDMDGFELAEFMRGKEGTKDVPIIFLTAGQADHQRRFRGYEAGAVDFLQKPIEADIIRGKANVFYELYRRRQEVARQRDELKAATDESRRYADALKEADQRKDEFLATLAHELRNPLAPLRNGLEVLRSNPQADNAANVLDIMGRQLTHMVRLIDDLLDMSRVSKGKVELRRERISIQRVVESALESARPVIESNRHELTVEMPQNPVWLYADLTRLGQVVANLLNNAAKYTPPGGKISLTVETHGANVMVGVRDNGVGIPEHMLGKIFDLFTQVKDSTPQSQGGLGIGLALVKHLVTMHGGTIHVESEGEAKGSLFQVMLPVAEAEAPSDENIGEAAEETAADQPHHILVVDDNVESAQTTGWMLEMLGHTCSLAHHGRDALLRAKELDPDVILLDIGLPDISGYDVCRELRKEERFRNTLIIAQTGWGQERDRTMALESGFSHHLVKPVTLQQITELLPKKASE